MCGFCAAAASPQSAAAANGEETGERCGVRRPRSGWSMSVLEETARCASMEAAKRLEVVRFGLPNKPTGTPERLEKPIRCGIAK